MKRYLFVTAILLATGLHATAQTPEQLWESANTAYINENYQEAVKDYESIRAQGYESDQLYLNLGNAYFKRGMTGKAIVNYNRALRMSFTIWELRTPMCRIKSTSFRLSLSTAGWQNCVRA